MIELEDTKKMAQRLGKLNPDVVAATCAQVIDIVPKSAKIIMGLRVMDALFDRELLPTLIENNVLGDAVAELEARQALPIHYKPALPSNININDSTNDDHLTLCRAAGQIWGSSRDGYLQTYPTSLLWSNSASWHIINYAGLVLKVSSKMEANPDLSKIEGVEDFLSCVENATGDIVKLVEAVEHQTRICPERVSPRTSALILETLGWLHGKDENLCIFDVNAANTLLKNVISSGERKPSLSQRKAVTSIRRRALSKIGVPKPGPTPLPKI